MAKHHCYPQEAGKLPAATMANAISTMSTISTISRGESLCVPCSEVGAGKGEAESLLGLHSSITSDSFGQQDRAQLSTGSYL